MARKRILTVFICMFFLLVGMATSTRHHSVEGEWIRVESEVRRLETRRDALEAAVEELERRCSDLEQQISEHENTAGDRHE